MKFKNKHALPGALLQTGLLLENDLFQQAGLGVSIGR